MSGMYGISVLALVASIAVFVLGVSLTSFYWQSVEGAIALFIFSWLCRSFDNDLRKKNGIVIKGRTYRTPQVSKILFSAAEVAHESKDRAR